VAVVVLVAKRSLRREELGLITRDACDLISRHVEINQSWPKSWDELAVPNEAKQSMVENVKVEFGLSIQEVSYRLKRNLPVIEPIDKQFAHTNYETAIVRLKQIVDAILKERGEDRSNANGSGLID
jgi:copper chaperone CopZ